MRADTPAFAEDNLSPAKEPHFAVVISFDSDNETLGGVRSSSRAKLPPGVLDLGGRLQAMAGTSQRLDPDKAVSSIGNWSFQLTDLNAAITIALNEQLALGRSTCLQRVQAFKGFEGLEFSDYSLIQTQLIENIDYDKGAYSFTCMDVQRAMRKEIFVPVVTTLAATLSVDAMVIDVYDTSLFEAVEHGPSYSDAPDSTVFYVKIDAEKIRCSGKTPTTFIVDTDGRGALNTVAAEHAIDASASPDRRTKVEELIYLEMPALKLDYAIKTGILLEQDDATLPAHWTLGMSTDYVRLADYYDKPDLWNPDDDEQGLILRFEEMNRTDGKKFLEEQVDLLLGCFPLVYADGSIGMRRMANVLAGAAYTHLLDRSNIVSHTALRFDYKSLHNVITVNWSWEPVHKAYLRKTTVRDDPSQVIYGESEPYEIECRGLHGSRHSSTTIRRCFNSIRDRYSGPPLRMTVTVMPSLDPIEVGQIVRVRLDSVRDFVAGTTLDRSFEVQQVQINWITGAVTLELFGSSQAPSTLPLTQDPVALSDAWYASEGTELSTVLTITGSNPGHISANGTLVGGEDMNDPDNIYYYLGDLVLDEGVEIGITDNVQLRVRGNFDINGDIDGAGQGLPGAATNTDGTAGFLGVTKSAGTLDRRKGTFGPLSRRDGRMVVGQNSVVPAANLNYDGTTLTGIFSDLRGTSGSGAPTSTDPDDSHNGGVGGNGGAALCTVSRGATFGASGSINLSGEDGGIGDAFTLIGSTSRAGSGGGGAPGGWLALIDGFLVGLPGLTDLTFRANQGKTPIMGNPLLSPAHAGGSHPGAPYYSYYVGTGDGTTFPLPSLSGTRGGCRVQYIPGNVAATPDPAAAYLLPPSTIELSSGTAALGELITNGDGTVVARIRAEWSASPDVRTIGYEVESKRSTDSIWEPMPPVFGSFVAFVSPVASGVEYDVRVRAVGPLRLVSPWVTETDYTVVGKTQPPSNVTGLDIDGTYAVWNNITDLDRAGFVVRYHHGLDTNFATAQAAHEAGFITETEFDTSVLSGGEITLLVCSIDTTGNLSTTPASIVTDLRPLPPNVFLISRQPDGTRQFTMSLTSIPTDFAGWKIRFAVGVETDYDAMTPLHEGLIVTSPWETNLLSAGTYTFAAKSVDQAGNESENATFITSELGDPRVAGSIENIAEEPIWSETKTDCHADSGTGWLIADNQDTFADLPSTWSAWDSWISDPVGTIVYEREIDIGTIVGFVPLITVTADGSVTIEESHSDDHSSWSSYTAVGPLLVTRWLRVRVTVTGSFPKIKTMRTILSAQPIREIVEDLDISTLTGAHRIGTGDFRAPFVSNFAVIKTASLVLQSVGSGWAWELLDKDVSVGPRFRIYHAGVLADPPALDVIIDGL